MKTLDAKPLPRDWPRIREIVVHGRTRWMVDGRPYRGRSVFETDALCRHAAYRMRLEVSGEATRALTLEDRVDASRALAALPAGMTLLEAVKGMTGKGDAGKGDLAEELRAWLVHRQAEVKAGRLVPRALWQDGWAVRAVCRDHEGSTVGAMDSEKAQGWLDGLEVGAYARRGIRGRLRNAWNWMGEKGRASGNPWQKALVEVPEASVVILSVPEAERLLGAAQAQPAAFRFALLGLGAGLRPIEAQKARAEDLLPPHTLHVRASKTQERYVQIDPWLYSRLTQAGEWPSNLAGQTWRKLWMRVRRAAGWNVAGGVPWPADVLRHSYASYWLAVHANRAALAEHMGNSVEVIARHYRRPVPREVGEAYFTALGGFTDQ